MSTGTAAPSRQERMKELARRVAALTPEQRAAFAARSPVVTIEGHALSIRNTASLCIQLGADVSVVGGYQQWRRAGRQVRKGEHGGLILIPRAPKGGQGDDSGATGTPDGDAEPSRLYFIGGTVFDISQTDPISEQNA